MADPLPIKLTREFDISSGLNNAVCQIPLRRCMLPEKQQKDL